MPEPSEIEGPVAQSRSAGRVDHAHLAAFEAVGEAMLMLRIGETKALLIDAWSRVVPQLAPSGHVTADDLREVGIGPAVFGAMTARCGKTRQEALSHAEFQALAPKLIEYWPVTDEGLCALESLLAEVAAARRP